MAISKSKTLVLTLFLLSTLTFAIRSPVPAPSASDDISKLLTNHGLAPGLFPDSVSRVKAENDGRMTVTLKVDCYARLSSSKALLHYQSTITGVIKFGTISEIKGVQLQQPSGWAAVTEMKYNVMNDNMDFYLGQLAPVPLPMDDFSVAPKCLEFLNDWISKIRSVTDAEV